MNLDTLRYYIYYIIYYFSKNDLIDCLKILMVDLAYILLLPELGFFKKLQLLVLHKKEFGNLF